MQTGTGSRSPRAARSRVLSGAASRDDRRDGEGGTLRGFANCPLLGSAAQGCQHPPHTACTKHTKHAWPWRGATGRGAMCVTCVAHFGQTANRRRTSDERTGAPQAERPGRPIPGLGGVSYTNWGWFPIRYVSWCILHVSCMYPEGYMYPLCILMYLKCILNALLHSKRIHVS